MAKTVKKAKKDKKAKKAKKAVAPKKIQRPKVTMEEVWDDFCEADAAHLKAPKGRKGMVGMKGITAVPKHIDWRMAKALEMLRAQINVLAPGRSKASDGGIGDMAHWKKGSASDHNPWIMEAASKGVVTARDFTHDVKGGCDCHKLVASLVEAKDTRIKYIIWDSHIYSSSAVNGQAAWAKRAYTGANKHNKHAHISVKSAKANYDDTSKWVVAVA